MELHTEWGPLHVCQNGDTVLGVGHAADVTVGTTAPAVLPCQEDTDVVSLAGTSCGVVGRRQILQTSGGSFTPKINIARFMTDYQLHRSNILVLCLNKIIHIRIDSLLQYI
jgi:hypothetical protein